MPQCEKCLKDFRLGYLYMTFVNGTGRPSYSLCAMKSVVRRARMWYDESVTGKYPCFYADVNSLFYGNNRLTAYDSLLQLAS